MKTSFFRSLSVKLTLAFIGVGLITILSVALIVGQQTQRDFNKFIRARIEVGLAENLIAYYAANGTWGGVDRYMLQPGDEGPNGNRGPAENRPNEEIQASLTDTQVHTGENVTPTQGVQVVAGLQGPTQGFNAVASIRVPFTIIGTDGKVIYSANMKPGDEASAAQLEKGTPLLVNGVQVGTLLITGPAPETVPFDQNERGFVNQVWRTLLWGGLGALMLALVMGGFIAATLTRPLRTLTEATQDVARGNLGRQVDVQSRDELGELAFAFNHMSSDLAHSVNLRRQMTADIAHDLRTPLSVILGYTEALDEGVLAPSQETYAILHDEAKHLSRLVDDLRTLSLAEAGELRLYMQKVSPEELLARATAAHKVQADQKGVTLSSHSDANLPLIQVDPERMAQVLHNLVSNALRYTPQGGTILLSATENNGGIEIAVQDSGQGIASEHLAKVFERFYRVDAARQQTGESGLGLPIAKSLVEMHGGTIAVSSEVGKGTTFTIHIPNSRNL
jgi:two-component system sensor histidine kinase BaeS